MEEVEAGLKEEVNKAREATLVAATWVQNRRPLAVRRDGAVMSLLRAVTGGDARRILAASGESSGFSGWHTLCAHFEPALAVREAHAAAELSNLVLHPAKTVAETGARVLELEGRARTVE